MSYDDPFDEPEKRPAWSWKDREVGAWFKATIVEEPKLVQGRDFKTKEPDTWPDGNPKMVAVTGLEIKGEEYSLWAPKPSALFRALVDAQKTAGARMRNGGELIVKFTAEKPTDGDPQRLFEARYTPPAPVASDPLEEEPPF